MGGGRILENLGLLIMWDWGLGVGDMGLGMWECGMVGLVLQDSEYGLEITDIQQYLLHIIFLSKL